jgi:protocatechuate 3,4-dioxygenase beta subunit
MFFLLIKMFDCKCNREGRPGISLRLAITVLDTRSCLPIPNAVVDLWHCDSAGLYSHYIAASQGQMGGPNDASTFFRGRIMFFFLYYYI